MIRHDSFVLEAQSSKAREADKSEASDGEGEKTAREALRVSELRYRRLFEAARDGILILDAGTGRITDVNPFLADLLGFLQSEMIGQTVGELSPFRDIESNQLMLERLQEEGYVRYRDLPLETKDGRKIAVEFVSNVYEAGEKKVIQCNVRDITERKRDDEEKARLAQIIQEMSEACFALDADWRFIFVNDRMESLLLRPREEMLGKTLWETFPYLANTPVEGHYRRAMRELAPVSFEVLSEGIHRWLEVRLSPSGDGLAGFILDIHERKEAEAEKSRMNEELERRVIERTAQLVGANAELDRHRSEIQRLFESLPGLYLVLTPDLAIVAASNAFLEATMTLRDQIMGRSFFDVFPNNPEDQDASGVPNLRASLEEVRRTAAPHTMAIQKYDVRKPNGDFEERFWSPINSPMLGLDGELKYIVHRVEDVTDFVRQKLPASEMTFGLRTRLEQMEAEIFYSAKKIQESNRQLEAANKELEAFSYSVSHDLRAPLRHVVGFVELLKADAGPILPEKSLRYVKTISEAAHRMGKLIDDLLSFSKVGRQAIRKAEVDLDQLVANIRGDFAAETDGRQIIWKIHPLPHVRGDESLLRMALVNLLSNAIKFTGTRAVAEIEMGTVAGGDAETVIYIRDNGAGFDPQFAAKLFGVFQRLHSQAEFEGTGIGLANVQRIIQRHGGRIWAEGILDGGATFFFSLPH